VEPDPASSDACFTTFRRNVLPLFEIAKSTKKDTRSCDTSGYSHSTTLCHVAEDWTSVCF